MAEPLFLNVRAAAEYVDCSKQERLVSVAPDRCLPGDVRCESGARLRLRHTLDETKPLVAAWPERDGVAATGLVTKPAAERESARARRAGMRKGSAVVAGNVCDLPGCSRTELNRWAADGRLPPDGQMVLTRLPKKANVRVWFPQTINTAKASRDVWRAQDRAKTVVERPWLRPVA